MSRFVFMMLDGVGVGALPDADAYGDVGADTLGHVAGHVALSLPNLERLGLGNIIPVVGVPPVADPLALVGRLSPLSAGKDTTVGHWEHMGQVTTRPFPTYPNGFPPEVIEAFNAVTGRGVLGNKPASGTAIIEELGERHLADGWPIVYTSADSVFQIAAHIDVVPLEQLYEWCEAARRLLVGEHALARVIARPFEGRPGAFVRRKERRDFSLEPPRPLYLDLLEAASVPVLALGKISEIYMGRGVTAALKIGSNAENLALVLDLLRGTSDRATFSEGLLFTNLVDFDMVWGHRNDPDGFAAGLEAVDAALPGILAALGPDDRLLITADHGVDPTTPGTDHTREYVPLLYYPRPDDAPQAVYEGGFADTGATVYECLVGEPTELAGAPAQRLAPKRGWRPYTATVPSPYDPAQRWPVRVGAEQAVTAAEWLRGRCGPAPRVAVVLGSGLSEALTESLSADMEPVCALDHADVPGWAAGSVEGHPGRLVVLRGEHDGVLLIQGRLHAYEGADLGELQLITRTVAAWGVKRILYTCAVGGLDPSLRPGDVVWVDEVLDYQFRGKDGGPQRLQGTDEATLAALAELRKSGPPIRRGTYAAVPGPQYETPAEAEFLRRSGATVVGMSLPAELRAARECGLEVAVVTLVTNVGAATHDDVLAGGVAHRKAFAAAAAALLQVYWST